MDEPFNIFVNYLTIMVEDKGLIKQLQNKDESALSVLYDNYSKALYGVILRMCKDENDAQNLLQDTFMTIWEKSNTYDFEKGRFYTWAYKIARNKTLNFLRKPNELIQIEDLSVYESRTENTINPQDFLKLKGTINRLEAHHQKAIELVYFNGLSHREAHEEMGVPLGTFKSYIKQALRQLRQSYLKVISFLMILMEVVR